MKTELKFSAAVGAASELLVVFAVDHSTSKDKDKDAKPELALLTAESVLTAAAESVLTSGEFKAAANETLLLHAPVGLAAKRLLLVGLGKAAKLVVPDVRKGAGTAVRFAKPRTIREVAIVVPEFETLPPGPCVRAIVEGALIADFDPDIYRSDRKDQSVSSVTVLAGDSTDQAALEAAFAEGVTIAESQNWARSLVNEPGNILTPTELGARAAAMAAEVGLKCEVYSTEKLHELKMGAFWAVAQGSEQPPALIVTTYEPEGPLPADGPVLGLIGKAITFDTGGISIKPADGMEKMKYDMAGGAAMLGAMRAIARLKPKVKVVSVVCSAENMPSGKAYRPGDVVTAMSGKTIEVMNTDAEGRMVLADGLHYAKQLGVTHLIDAATLTGACVVALGMVNAGAFSNDDETYGHFAEATKISGDKFWRLPEEDDYRDQIKSQIADIMNTGGSRWGGAITAAMFLKEFVGETPWIHLDIAGVAWMEDQKPWIAKGPSGTPVRSLVEWVRSYAE
jgi:leucyl aminopeptidase